MNTIAFDGVEYIKASVAAKDFGYTSDYIGQLCRAKKIDARLVGRTWFVSSDSIVAHKRNKHAKKASPESSSLSVTAIKTKPSRVKIDSVVKNKTAKLVNNIVSAEPKERILKVAYDRDEEALLPTLVKKVLPPPKRLRIEHANSKKIRIIGQKKKIANFKAEELPDVALSGKLSITSYPDRVVDSSDDKKPAVDSETAKEDSVSSTHEKKSSKQKAKKTVVKQPKKTGLQKPTSMSGVKPYASVAASTGPSKAKAEFTPSSIKTQVPVPVSAWVMISPAIATILAVIISVVIFSLSSETVATQTVFNSSFTLQLANLLEFLSDQKIIFAR